MEWNIVGRNFPRLEAREEDGERERERAAERRQLRADLRDELGAEVEAEHLPARAARSPRCREKHIKYAVSRRGWFTPLDAAHRAHGGGAGAEKRDKTNAKHHGRDRHARVSGHRCRLRPTRAPASRSSRGARAARRACGRSLRRRRRTAFRAARTFGRVGRIYLFTGRLMLCPVMPDA